jgi:penicillin-binding protein 2
MLIFDQLKKDDPQLRLLAIVVFAGLLILLSGLWWVQLVSSRSFQHSLENQSIRTVLIPAVRGKILDFEGRPLAENRPSYNIDLYLEELSKNYQAAYTNALGHAKQALALRRDIRQKQLGRKLSALELRQFAVTKQIVTNLQQETRYAVTSNLVTELSSHLQEPIPFTEKEFQASYFKARALPMPILSSLTPVELARFEEQSAGEPGMDLEVQSMRFYPNGTVAAHLLGYLNHDDESEDSDATAHYSYRLPDYRGETGIEGLFDKELRGMSGEKSVVVNYLGYRQSESIWQPPEPGDNVVLTIDLDIQKAADEALEKAQANVRGAVVVMDAQTGDILAMASAPSYDPNLRIHPDPATKAQEDERWNDEALGLQRDRAIYENYHPGSIFKIVVAMAALEVHQLDPNKPFDSLGYYMVGKRRIGDTAGPGEFDFNLAMAKSSNPYFIDHGLRPGVLPEVIKLGERLHLGEKTGIMPHQEAAGNFPTLDRISSDWRDGDTANLSIGQGVIDVTPIQMAVMTAAVANGGKVFWPRVVERIENADGSDAVEPFAQGRIRDYLGVSAHTLKVVHGGMLADTQLAEGSGHKLNVPGWNIAGKTGTAEVERNGHKDRSAKDTWFVSFGPEENPRYVVVATVEGGASGGLTCVPIAHSVYLALQERDRKLEQKNALKTHALATAQ